MERNAFVAMRVVVRADVLVAGIAEENGAGDELERTAAGAIPERAGAHVRQREVLVMFRKRPGGRTKLAAIVDDAQRRRLEQGRACHRWLTSAARMQLLQRQRRDERAFTR